MITLKLQIVHLELPGMMTRILLHLNIPAGIYPHLMCMGDAVGTEVIEVTEVTEVIGRGLSEMIEKSEF